MDLRIAMMTPLKSSLSQKTKRKLALRTKKAHSQLDKSVVDFNTLLEQIKMQAPTGLVLIYDRMDVSQIREDLQTTFRFGSQSKGRPKTANSEVGDIKTIVLADASVDHIMPYLARIFFLKQNALLSIQEYFKDLYHGETHFRAIASELDYVILQCNSIPCTHHDYYQIFAWKTTLIRAFNVAQLYASKFQKSKDLLSSTHDQVLKYASSRQ